ncbi:MAG: PAS domain-containing sensor histidine kinase [Gammaproteobacteria bacterium]|nr:PAS domain-containing sensor histidine kinase [Gammaproteobacteria bacterium]MDH5802316.1 PAS domain-containing sensor histidine kinase [Gammaproteobacteria bacterium]
MATADIKHLCQSTPSQTYDPEILVNKIQSVAKMGMWDWNIEENTLFWSDEYFRLLGLDGETVKPDAEVFISMVHPDDRSALMNSIELSMRKAVSYNIEYRLVLKSGEIKTMREWGETVFDKDEHPIRMVGYMQDISAFKKAHMELELVKQELELLVQQRTSELELENFKLRKSLEQIQFAQYRFVQSEKNTTLNQLVESVSSEVNAPIGVAITATSHLRNKSRHIDYADTEHAQEELVLLSEYVEEFTDLILKNLNRASEFLRRTEKSSSQELPQRFHLQTHLQNIVDNLKPELEGRHYAIDIQCPDDIYQFGAKDSYEQVFKNLIMNSVIHGFEGRIVGNINIVVEKIGKELTFTYRDNGKGISKADVTRLFEPFYTTRRKHGGSGLGMYFVRNLIDRNLSGNIACIPQKIAAGAYFQITVPHRESDPKIVYLQ